MRKITASDFIDDICELVYQYGLEKIEFGKITPYEEIKAQGIHFHWAEPTTGEVKWNG